MQKKKEEEKLNKTKIGKIFILIETELRFQTKQQIVTSNNIY